MRYLALLLSVLLISHTVSAQDDPAPEDLADANGHFATVNGASIYYVTEGDPSDPAILFVHGFGGSTFTWRENLAQIAQADYYAIALDLPPFGLSDKSPDIGYTRADYADYIVGLMDVLGIRQATLVGHSMGGTAIAQFALDYPQRMNALVFVAAAVSDGAIAGSNSPTNTGIFSALDPDNPAAVTLLRSILRPSVFTNLLTGAYFNPEIVTDEVAAGYQRPLQTANWPEGFLAYLGADNSNDPTASDLMAVVDVPSLIIWGQDDTWVPLEVGQALHAALPQSLIITYEQTGHLPMEEQVQAFNEDLLNFLSGLDHGDFDADLLIYNSGN